MTPSDGSAPHAAGWWTPGPWEARPLNDDEWEVVKDDATKPTPDDPWFICECFDGADGASAAANARLIAAAPELANLVIEAVANFDDGRTSIDLELDWIARARNALAKALPEPTEGK